MYLAHLLPVILRALPHPAESLTFFAGLVDQVRLAMRLRKDVHEDKGPLLLHVWAWLGRASTRLDRLYTRWQGGKPRPTPRATRSSERKPDPTRVRFPRRRSWLVRLAQGAVIGSSAFPELLKDADFVRFARETPGARRILRPFCVMTGAEQPDWLKLPPRQRKPRPRKERAPKPPREGSRAWYERLNTRPDGTRKYWPDCYGPRKWAFKKPA